MSVVDFYDELAPDYHLIYEDWNTAVEHQSVALDRLVRSRVPDAHSVLDCSCGIGTQALGLAGLGYKVHGTDVSERSLDRSASIAREWSGSTSRCRVSRTRLIRVLDEAVRTRFSMSLLTLLLDPSGTTWHQKQ